MDVRNCKRCGKIYNYMGSSVCGNCLQEEQQDFDKVREYLFENPKSNANEVSQATGVDIKVISRFLKENRLRADFAQMSTDELTCEKCGKPISSGRFCDVCVKDMQAEFSKAVKPLGSNSRSSFEPGKMHTFEHILKRK